MSLKILACSSLYCSRVIPPFSRRVCHLSSCSMHCERICNLLLGEITVLVGLRSSTFEFTEVEEHTSDRDLRRLGGSSYDPCFPICIRCPHILSFSSVYLPECFFLRFSKISSTSSNFFHNCLSSSSAVSSGQVSATASSS